MRRRNLGETPSQRAYINISHMTRLRDAFGILANVVPSLDPLNIPEEEYRSVMRAIDGWIGNLENRRKIED